MKATKAQVQQRIEEVLRIRLDGAEFWDVREYAREKEKEAGSPWELKEAAKPLSDGQLWRYVAQADKLIAESCRASRKKLVRRHLAKARNLFAKAVASGDIRAALACLKVPPSFRITTCPRRYSSTPAHPAHTATIPTRLRDAWRIGRFDRHVAPDYSSCH
jgi:hypothetical protein